MSTASLFFLAAIITCVIQNTSAQITKGSVLLSGDVSYNDITYNPSNQQNQNGFNINASGGYFVKENLAFG